jgi:hypothetical protein
MVDALKRAHRIVRPDGVVLDVHPTSAYALLEVGSHVIGTVSPGDAPERHQAATDAVATAIARGWFSCADTVEFAFLTYGDSIDELREYLTDNWRDTTIDAATVAHARAALQSRAGLKPAVREHVRIAKLRPR